MKRRNIFKVFEHGGDIYSLSEELKIPERKDNRFQRIYKSARRIEKGKGRDQKTPEIPP